jgi:hypothetical protein
VRERPGLSLGGAELMGTGCCACLGRVAPRYLVVGSLGLARDQTGCHERASGDSGSVPGDAALGFNLDD